MGTTLDYILTFGAIILGILLLTGHGSFLMKGGDEYKRKKLYDENKMEKATGVAMLLVGAATGLDSFTTGVAAKIGYIVVVALIFAALIYYLKVKCKK